MEGGLRNNFEAACRKIDFCVPRQLKFNRFLIVYNTRHVLVREVWNHNLTPEGLRDESGRSDPDFISSALQTHVSRKLIRPLSVLDTPVAWNCLPHLQILIKLLYPRWTADSAYDNLLHSETRVLLTKLWDEDFPQESVLSAFCINLASGYLSRTMLFSNTVCQNVQIFTCTNIVPEKEREASAPWIDPQKRTTDTLCFE